MTQTEATSTTEITPKSASADPARPRGQVLVLFALLLTFLLGTTAFVVDLAWIWVNELKVQRAADAAALAGVVHLPGAVGLANSSALGETDLNGYQDSTDNAGQQVSQAVDVWARPDPADPRRMLVRVQTNIDTFFMQIFGFDTLRITRDAKAEYILPVPMGSPENYYGVFGQLRTPDGGIWQPNPAASTAPRTSAGVIVSATTANPSNTHPAASPPTGNSSSCSTATVPGTVQWGQFPAAPGPLASDTMDDRVSASDNQWLRSSTAASRVCLGNLGITFPLNPPSPGGSAPAYPGHQILGIEVRVEAFASDISGCAINADLMWGNPITSGQANNTSGSGDKTMLIAGNETPPPVYQTLGGSIDPWNRSWTQGEITSPNFRVRLWNNDPGACSALDAGQPAAGIRNPGPAGATSPSGPVAGEVYIDVVQVVVHYRTFTWVPDPVVVGPYNDTLNARGLWGTFINQGAEKVNGDAYLPKWNPRTSPQNNEYRPDLYYNYAIEMPAGATEGEVWIYDAPFCATDGGGQYGTGDRYFGSSHQATAAYYTLYNTFNTPFDFGDDLASGTVSTAHSIFANTSQLWSDATLDGPTGASYTSCAWGATGTLSDGRFWHNRWYPMQPAGAGEAPVSAEQPYPLLATGPVGYANAPRLTMTAGNTYRLHTRGTDPANANLMNNANGHNSFAIFARAWCGTVSLCPDAPRVYGLGAMQAFTPLRGGGSAQFYLAEIDPIHEGKSLEIRLWDPGDTGALPANLRVLYPSGGTYNNATLDFVASNIVTVGASVQTAPGAAACNGRTDESTGNSAFITTNTGGFSQYNGCWLTIVVVIPNGYDGDACPGVPACLDQNWWKIQYDMGGSTSDNAFDLTTWQVTLRGNPVHLVVP